MLNLAQAGGDKNECFRQDLEQNKIFLEYFWFRTVNGILSTQLILHICFSNQRCASWSMNRSQHWILISWTMFPSYFWRHCTEENLHVQLFMNFGGNLDTQNFDALLLCLESSGKVCLWNCFMHMISFWWQNRKEQLLDIKVEEVEKGMEAKGFTVNAGNLVRQRSCSVGEQGSEWGFWKPSMWCVYEIVASNSILYVSDGFMKNIVVSRGS